MRYGIPLLLIVAIILAAAILYNPKDYSLGYTVDRLRRIQHASNAYFVNHGRWPRKSNEVVLADLYRWLLADGASRQLLPIDGDGNPLFVDGWRRSFMVVSAPLLVQRDSSDDIAADCPGDISLISSGPDGNFSGPSSSGVIIVGRLVGQ